MTDKPWKLVLLLAGIFAAGAVTGSFVTVRMGRQMMQKHIAPPDQMGPMRFKLLVDKLELTPEQQEKLRPIVMRNMEEMGRVRMNSLAEARRIAERMNKDITAVLTPEQKAKFDEMNRKMRERFQRFLRDRPFGPGGLRPGPDRPPGGMPPPPAEQPKDKSPEV